MDEEFDFTLEDAGVPYSPEVVDAAKDAIRQVNTVGFCRDHYHAIRAIDPNFLPTVNPLMLTVNPSATKQAIAQESLKNVGELVGRAIIGGTIGYILGRFLQWLHSKLTGGGSGGGGGGGSSTGSSNRSGGRVRITMVERDRKTNDAVTELKRSAPRTPPPPTTDPTEAKRVRSLVNAFTKDISSASDTDKFAKTFESRIEKMCDDSLAYARYYTIAKSIPSTVKLNDRITLTESTYREMGIINAGVLFKTSEYMDLASIFLSSPITTSWILPIARDIEKLLAMCIDIMSNLNDIGRAMGKEGINIENNPDKTVKTIVFLAKNIDSIINKARPLEKRFRDSAQEPRGTLVNKRINFFSKDKATTIPPSQVRDLSVLVNDTIRDIKPIDGYLIKLKTESEEMDKYNLPAVDLNALLREHLPKETIDSITGAVGASTKLTAMSLTMVDSVMKSRERIVMYLKRQTVEYIELALK